MLRTEIPEPTPTTVSELSRNLDIGSYMVQRGILPPSKIGRGDPPSSSSATIPRNDGICQIVLDYPQNLGFYGLLWYIVGYTYAQWEKVGKNSIAATSDFETILIMFTDDVRREKWESSLSHFRVEELEN